jgi:hypothetical protein
MDKTPARELRRTLFVVRWVLPSALTLAGIVLVCIDPQGDGGLGGLGVIGAGLAAFLFAYLAKMSMSGDTARDKDNEQSAFFDEHGYWPDEDPSAARGIHRVGSASD